MSQDKKLDKPKGKVHKVTLTGKARIVASSDMSVTTQYDVMGQVLDQAAQPTLPQATQRLKTDKEPVSNRGARMSSALAYNTLPKTLDKQISIFDVLNQEQAIRRVIVENNLDKIGAELSVPEQRALGATLELLHNTGAYRRADELLEQGASITPEEIVVPLQDYLKAYGAEKVVTGRSKLDYPRSEVQEALQGLKGLTKPVMQLWGLKKGTGKGYNYAERTYGGLVAQVSEQYYDVTDKTYKELASGDTSVALGAKYIRILPSKIFYTRPFIRYPRHLVTELRTYLKDSNQRLTTTVLNVVNMLSLEAHNDNDTVVRDYHTMIAQSGQNKAVEGGRSSPRRYKRAEERINKALDQTKAIGAVKDHQLETDPVKGKQYRIKIDAKKIKGEDSLPDTTQN
jgi:hypothetical protein